MLSKVSDMSEFSDALNRFQRAYAHLFDLVDQYPAARAVEAGACGTWSVKDVLAHFSGWTVEAQRRYLAYGSGINDTMQYDFDQFNADSVRSRAGLSWPQMVDELRRVVENFQKQAAALTPAQVAAEPRYATWLDDLAEDVETHTEGLQRFLSQAQLARQAYPLLEFDPTPTAMIEPQQITRPVEGIAETCVLCFFHEVIARVAEGAKVISHINSEMGQHPVYEIQANGGRFVLAHPGLGGPMAAAFLDELIALGCRKFIAAGGAGVLKPELTVGHVVVPTTAVRDEGASYHYLPPGREVAASPAAVAAIESVLQKHDVPYVTGKTWTTDGIYRETPAKVALRRDEGCLTVEMEAATFFAVAQFRGVTFGQILYGGDDLSGEEWDSRNWVHSQASTREKLLWLAAEAVQAL